MSEEIGGAGLGRVEHPMQSSQSNPPWRRGRPFRRGNNMIRRDRTFAFVHALLTITIGILAASSGFAQVSPPEIANPKLRSAEQEYLPQLQSLQHAIGKAQFPLPFILTRYVGVDPARQAALDTRGLEFVYFQDRVLLKISGFYTAAFNSDQLTVNERASRTFQEVIAPILGLIAEQISPDVKCEGIGFEIAYHVRSARGNSDFEGREILVVVLDRADAFAFLSESGNDRRQTILDRSGIYLDAKPFGLALDQKDALNRETLGKSGPGEVRSASSPSFADASTPRLSSSNARLAPTTASSPSHATPAGNGANSLVRPTAPATDPKASPAPDPSPVDVERLQAQFQSQLDAFLKENGNQFHLVDYAPPTFALYHKQLVLQLTLRSPLSFDKSTSSIYKRAAQSFDLFLAPQLKALIPKLPSDHQVDALDFSILNRLGNEKNASEAVEFICPLKSVRSFVEDGITSQDLIDQSLVLVNGVRINLHLELVE